MSCLYGCSIIHWQLQFLLLLFFFVYYYINLFSFFSLLLSLCRFWLIFYAILVGRRRENDRMESRAQHNYEVSAVLCHTFLFVRVFLIDNRMGDLMIRCLVVCVFVLPSTRANRCICLVVYSVDVFDYYYYFFFA